MRAFSHAALQRALPGGLSSRSDFPATSRSSIAFRSRGRDIRRPRRRTLFDRRSRCLWRSAPNISGMSVPETFWNSCLSASSPRAVFQAASTRAARSQIAGAIRIATELDRLVRLPISHLKVFETMRVPGLSRQDRRAELEVQVRQKNRVITVRETDRCGICRLRRGPCRHPAWRRCA